MPARPKASHTSNCSHRAKVRVPCHASVFHMPTEAVRTGVRASAPTAGDRPLRQCHNHAFYQNGSGSVALNDSLHHAVARSLVVNTSPRGLHIQFTPPENRCPVTYAYRTAIRYIRESYSHRALRMTKTKRQLINFGVSSTNIRCPCFAPSEIAEHFG